MFLIVCLVPCCRECFIMVEKFDLTLIDPVLRLSERGKLDVGHTNSCDIGLLRLMLLLSKWTAFVARHTKTAM